VTAAVALYGHWICPFATRVEFALHQRGIDHELIDLPPSAVRGPEFVLPDEFVEHSPHLEIPMVRFGDDYRADSIPVLEWMEERVATAPLLPADESGRSLVRERMAWIDQHAFRAMIEVYYGTEVDRITRASETLADALAEMGRWTVETGWLAGTEPTLAEAVAMPIHVRMAGLRRLGFKGELTDDWQAHAERCRQLPGWAGVAWSQDQTDEFVARFESFRRKASRQSATERAVLRGLNA
jgi:glutathione S-transferase